MSLDSSVRKVVTRVMAKIGTPVILRRITPGVYNPTTRTIGNAAKDYSVKGRLDDFTDREVIAGAGSILASDRKLYLAAADLPIVPLPHDRVVLEDLEYDVCDPVRREMAQDQPAMYLLQLRR